MTDVPAPQQEYGLVRDTGTYSRGVGKADMFSGGQPDHIGEY